jgi:hypothetical protein
LSNQVEDIDESEIDGARPTVGGEPKSSTPLSVDVSQAVSPAIADCDLLEQAKCGGQRKTRWDAE